MAHCCDQKEKRRRYKMEIQDGKLNIISSLMSYLFVFLVEDCNSYWSVFTQVQRQKQTWRIYDSCQNVVTSMSMCHIFSFCCFCYSFKFLQWTCGKHPEHSIVNLLSLTFLMNHHWYNCGKHESIMSRNVTLTQEFESERWRGKSLMSFNSTGVATSIFISDWVELQLVVDALILLYRTSIFTPDEWRAATQSAGGVAGEGHMISHLHCFSIRCDDILA